MNRPRGRNFSLRALEQALAQAKAKLSAPALAVRLDALQVRLSKRAAATAHRALLAEFRRYASMQHPYVAYVKSRLSYAKALAAHLPQAALTRASQRCLKRAERVRGRETESEHTRLDSLRSLCDRLTRDSEAGDGDWKTAILQARIVAHRDFKAGICIHAKSPFSSSSILRPSEDARL